MIETNNDFVHPGLPLDVMQVSNLAAAKLPSTWQSLQPTCSRLPQYFR
jgi:hypothetical protein